MNIELGPRQILSLGFKIIPSNDYIERPFIFIFSIARSHNGMTLRDPLGKVSNLQCSGSIPVPPN